MSPAHRSPPCAVAQDASRAASLARALDSYLRAAQDGSPPDRVVFLGRHPDLAPHLGEALDALALVLQARDGPQSFAESLGAGILPAELPHRALGDFLLLGELGRGGMGIVYEAVQLSLSRPVALKVLPLAAALDARQLRRFQNEARAAAALDHPHIVPVYAVGCERGIHYLAMRLIRGCNLAQVVAGLRSGRQGACPPADSCATLPAQPDAGRGGDRFRLAAGWGLQAAEALAYAHDEGVVHRDVKPANLLLDHQGHLWVADFGLARLGVEAGLTGTCELAGTPRYMSPEQATPGAPLDQRTDVYSLGATLYELLTLRPPFGSDHEADVLGQIRGDEPVPPRRIEPGIPRDLETICLKCLDKQPQGRYHTAGELAEDLRRFLAGRPIRARRAGVLERGWRWCRRNPAVASLAALSLVVALVLLPGLLWLWSLRAHAEERADLEGRAARAQQFYRLLSQVRERRVRGAAGWTWDNARDLKRAVQLLPSAEDLPELRSEVAACAAAVDLRLVRTVAPGFTAHRAAFAPHGRLLALAQGVASGPLPVNVLLVDPDTGDVLEKLTYPSAAAWQRKAGRSEFTTALAFSPDGRWLVAGTRSGHLHCWDLTRDVQAATWPAHAEAVRRLAFSPDGRLLFSLSEGGVLRRWNPGPSKPWPHVELPARMDGLAALAAEAAVVCSEGGRVVVRDPDSWTPRRRLDVPGGGLAVNPAGCAFVRDPGDGLELFDLHLGQRLARLAVVEGWSPDRVAFSPDGSLLAVASGTVHRLQVWETAGGRLAADVVVPGGREAVAFSPDGRLLAVTGDGRTFLYEVGGLREQTFAAHQGGPVRDLAFNGQTVACLAEYTHRCGWKVAGVAFAAFAEPGHNPPAWFTGAPPPFGPYRLAVDPTGPTVFSTRSDSKRGALTGWEPTRGRETFCGSFERELKDLRLSPDGRLWAAAGNEVLCGRAPQESLVPCLTNDPTRRAEGAVFYSVAAGRRWALAGRRDGRVFLFDAATARPHSSWAVDESPVCCLALSPDASEGQALAGTELGKVRLLELPSGRTLRDLPGHLDGVTAVAFLGPDLVASASRDGTVRLSRVDGEEILRLPAPGPVERMAVSPDGTRLALLVEKERAARVWHLGRLAERLTEAGLEADLPGEAGLAGLPAEANRRPESPGAAGTTPFPPPLVERPRSPQGLKAELFAGDSFQRKIGERFHAGIDFRTDVDRMDQGVPLNHHSVRWSGWLKAPAGRYLLSVEYDDHFRLWVDDRLVLDCWQSALGGGANKAEVDLTGRPHSLRLDYCNVTCPSRCVLRWRPPGKGALEVVPPAALFHDRAAAERTRRKG